jgi:DNA polymerase III gamma/tau subunit
MSDRLISGVLSSPDATLDATLRPSLFSEFTGQSKVRERLEIALEAALQRSEPLDHVLLSGPPGLGKTTIANIIAKSMGGNLKCTSGPTIEKGGPGRAPHQTWKPATSSSSMKSIASSGLLRNTSTRNGRFQTRYHY